MSRAKCIMPGLFVVLSVLSSVAQHVPSPCISGTESIPFLTKPEDGWDVSFVDKEHIIKSGKYILSDGTDSGLQYVEYGFKKQVITLPHVEVNPCDHTGTIREWHLIPMQVIAFEKNGRLFAYHVWTQMVAGPQLNSQVLGAQTNVMFYDMDGDGIFDSVRLGAGIAAPLVPDWVLGKAKAKSSE